MFESILKTTKRMITGASKPFYHAFFFMQSFSKEWDFEVSYWPPKTLKRPSVWISLSPAGARICPKGA